jgi:phosphoserine phosphatase
MQLIAFNLDSVVTVTESWLFMLKWAESEKALLRRVYRDLQVSLRHSLLCGLNDRTRTLIWQEWLIYRTSGQMSEDFCIHEPIWF